MGRDSANTSAHLLYGAFAIFFLTLLGSFLIPFLEFDAATYFLDGIEIARGGMPYVSFVENKNPGTFYLLAIPALITQSPYGPLLLWRGIELLIVVVLFALTSRISSSHWKRILALSMFCLTYFSMLKNGFETIYTETPEALFLLLAVWAALNRKAPSLVGLFLAIAFLMRQTAFIYLPLFVAYDFLLSSRNDRTRASVITRTIFLVLGVAAPVALLSLLSYYQGWAHDWWLEAYVWPSQFAAQTANVVSRFPAALLSIFTSVEFPALGFSLALWVCVFFRTKNESGWEHRSEEIFFISLFLVSVFESALPSFPYVHYYIPVAGFVPLMLIALLERIDLIPSGSYRTRYAAVSLVVIAITSFPSIFVIQRSAQVKMSLPRVAAAKALGAWVSQNTKLEDSILAWGFFPQLYLTSMRNPGSSFSHNYLLTNFDERFLPINEEFLQKFNAEIQSRRPIFIFLFSKIPPERYSDFIRDGYTKRSVTIEGREVRYLERNAR